MAGKKLYDIVKDLLEKYPPLRDSDRLLIWNVWGITGFLDGSTISKENFLKAPNTESIRRVRQKIQEEIPALEASDPIKAARNLKEEEKGTFAYREEVKEKTGGHWETDSSTGTAWWVEK